MMKINCMDFVPLKATAKKLALPQSSVLPMLTENNG